MNSEMRREGVLTVYGVDNEDGEWFHTKLQDFKGPAGKSLFKEMIARYEFIKLISDLTNRIEALEDKLSEKESEKEVKTMGGNKL